MGRGEVVVQIEKKGFVSSSYVFVNTLLSVIITLFFWSITWMIHASWLEQIGCLLLTGVSSWFTVGYSNAPIAYNRYKINSVGIKCGKNFIKYSDIENISIVEGYIEEWWRFRAVKNSMRVQPQTDIALEDIISVNCNFSGFEKKKASCCIYLPKTVAIDKVLRERCVAYAQVSDEWEKRKATFPKGLGMEKQNIGLTVFSTIYGGILIIMAVVMFSGSNYPEPYKLFVPIFFGLLMIMIFNFKSYIVTFVANKFVR